MEAVADCEACGRRRPGSRARGRSVAVAVITMAIAHGAAAAPDGAEEPPRAGTGSTGSGAAPARPIVTVAPGAACDAASTQQFVHRAEQTFAAGFPAAALALINRALVCKPDDQLYRRAALYACAARNAASAQWSYNRLPASARAPIAQRCRQERIALNEPPPPVPPAPVPPPPVVAVAPPSAPTPRVTPPQVTSRRLASAAPDVPPARREAPGCPTARAEQLVEQAAKRFAEGAASEALALYRDAIDCWRDPLMYPLAAVYACVARDAAAVQHYYGLSSSLYQPAIRQRCAQEGIALSSSKSAPAP